MPDLENIKPTDFIREAVNEDLKSGRFTNVHTRFPPEPNGYLHIGHTKALIIDFGIAQEFGGLCNLRYDDTNPTKEDVEYVDAIKDDIHWLGFSWDDREYLRLGLFRAVVRDGRQVDQEGQSLRRRSIARRSERHARHTDRTRQRKPVAQSIGGREPRSVRAHEERRVSRRHAHAARQDRYGVGQLPDARSR